MVQMVWAQSQLGGSQEPAERALEPAKRALHCSLLRGPWNKLGGLWSQLGSPLKPAGRPGGSWEGQVRCSEGKKEKEPVAQRHQMVSGSNALLYGFFLISFLVYSMQAGQQPR